VDIDLYLLDIVVSLLIQYQSVFRNRIALIWVLILGIIGVLISCRGLLLLLYQSKDISVCLDNEED